MEGQEQASYSDMFEPCVAAAAAAENPSFENFREAGEAVFRNAEQCGTVSELDYSELVGVPVVVAGGSDVEVGDGGQVAAAAKMEMEIEVKVGEKIEVKVGEKSGVKRKRGRPPRVQGKIQAKPLSKVTDEEDVCFICFDGGNLVLCDRRGCPKAYHPTCIKRDESFFQSNAKWNCGWHICSNCEKASHYMCYTCTYSLCKGCIKDADILCARGNKGFCTTCMRTIILIENSDQGNKDTIQVDFDDKSSWEYLFKVYWIYLKTKLSLTFEELTKAKNPGKRAVLVAHKTESSDELYDGNDDKGYSHYSFSGYQEVKTHRRKKTKKQPKLPSKENSLRMTKSYDEKASSLPEGAEWASKELLEFVAHMNNGDTSVLSQFDVQALLLEYIKTNNLRDPRRKSQIICDSRLGNMFGKARVGHFEMLKLLELHFVNKEVSQANSIIQGGFVSPIATQFEVDGAIDNQMMMGKDKKRKTRKMGVDRRPQTNLDEYAAIDFHNISLIYLRRSVMENLIEDIENFQGKVVGSVVRIRISDCDQKQGYRLVRVIGTSKVAAPYKVGQRTVDVMLEIFNLDKKEVISTDEISNQEFSKDECIRLRQSIKVGLFKRFTVGEILEKAMALQAVRVNDWLEAETLRLNHLRDRASEKGHRKELRECVEKLELMNAPEERQRRQLEIPKVHADPRMEPSYDSDDAGESDHKKQGDNVGPRYSNYSKRGKKSISQQSTGDTSKVKNISARKNSTTCSEQNRNMSIVNLDKDERATRTIEGENGPLVYPQRGAYGTNSWENPRNMVDPSGSATGACNNQAVVRTESCTGVSSGTSTVSFSVNIADNREIEKIWHYRDPSGTIQGPFSMLQLRKWSTSGFFPPDLRIWRLNEKQDDSLLLTDAMNGRNHKDPQLMHTSYDATAHSNENNEFARNSFSASCSPPADIASGVTQAGRLLQGWDLVKSKQSWFDNSQMHSSVPSPTFSGKPSEIVSHQGREHHRCGRWYTDQNHGLGYPDRTAVFQSKSGLNNDKCSNSQNNSGQSSKKKWKHPPVDCSSIACNTTSKIVSVTKSIETRDQNHDFLDLPSPTPLKPSNQDCKGLAAENKQSVSSNVPIPDSGSSWSSASSLVGGEAQAQLPGVAGEWGGYSPTPAKHSVEEWEPNPVSGSSLKPTELGGDLAAIPTSKGDELIHSSVFHPAFTTSDWQAIVTGPNEFPLAEESVSDLLAEVDAMESLNGPPSPTSAMNCTLDMTLVSKDECFSSLEGLSPTPDPGKSDALSYTSDVLMPCQSAWTNGPNAALQADVHDPQKRSGGNCSSSDEAEGEANPKAVSISLQEASSEIQPPESSSASWDMPATDGEWRGGLETTDTGWGPVQQNATLGWGGPVQININMGWGNGQGNPQANANINWGNSPGNLGVWGSQPKYEVERFPGQRDRGFQGRGPGYGRDRSSWNRQSSFGGGGSFGPPPKGQRICKFYESGRCKKGAFCNYLHP